MSVVKQESLFSASEIPTSPEVADAIELLRSAGGIEERGAVFTASAVVEAILDLCEYTADKDLERLRLLEPSFGGGDFLLSAVRRLMESYRRRGKDPCDDLASLCDCVRAVELHRETFRETREAIHQLLADVGLSSQLADTVLGHWLINDDYLLSGGLGRFDVVVGNPPYVRQERIPRPLLQSYRDRFETFAHRADIYVVFYEKGLRSLNDGGRLGFICANRWVKNQYGRSLRALISRGFQLEYFVDLERADAFKETVIAYPAITVLRRNRGAVTMLACEGEDPIGDLTEVVPALQAGALGEDVPDVPVKRVEVVRPNGDPWLLDAPDVVKHLRDLEERYPPLEEAGARVTIGVATGADSVFLDRFDELPVEESRKLPLAMASDCRGGRVEWSGMGVVNPFLEDGSLAPLEAFPRFHEYLREHETVLRKRHVARKSPDRWYRTIDRIHATMQKTPKLLIPDIKGDAAIAYDPGRYYPHHNLYVVTGTDWDTRALMTLLRSSVALAFVAAYSPRMAGGFLRFQAQYLRRIRCPYWLSLGTRLQRRLVEAADEDRDICDELIFRALEMRPDAQRGIRGYAESVRVGGSVS